MALKGQQVDALTKIKENNEIIIGNNEAIITDLNKELKYTQKSLKRQKAKTLITGFLGIIGIGLVTYLSIN